MCSWKNSLHTLRLTGTAELENVGADFAICKFFCNIKVTVCVYPRYHKEAWRIHYPNNYAKECKFIRIYSNLHAFVSEYVYALRNHLICITEPLVSHHIIMFNQCLYCESLHSPPRTYVGIRYHLICKLANSPIKGQICC